MVLNRGKESLTLICGNAFSISAYDVQEILIYKESFHNSVLL